MKILFLSRSYNSLTQRLHVELAALGHEVSIEFDIADSVTEEAVALFRPDVVIASFMKRAIPESVWRNVRCLIVHPGIVGDRGASALDWAILAGEREWGVTVLQAEAAMDAGPVWATEAFPMRAGATKSSLYRNEVTEAAVRAVLAALERIALGEYVPQRVQAGDPGVRGIARPLMKQSDRALDWQRHSTDELLARLNASDGVPGVLDRLFDEPVFLFDAHRGEGAAPADAVPGRVVARCHGAVQVATRDASLWIGHARRLPQGEDDTPFKLPATQVLAAQVAGLPERDGYPEIAYEEHGSGDDCVGVLHFPFYNGAMGTAQCERLLAAYRQALARPTRVLLLAGGPDFFSNGIHLNLIEAAASPADESWRNINAIDDVCEAVISTTDRLVFATLQGNAGAGGVFLALTADAVWAREGVILNPHYKNMGNLYGSEYWTYTLPRRVKRAGGSEADARRVMDNRLPLSAAQAQAAGLVDKVIASGRATFLADAIARAQRVAAGADFAALVRDKLKRRQRHEAERPLAAYRADELARMRRNFYGFDSSYHVARSYFVHKTLHSWSPRHLALHRRGPAAPERQAVA
ncbi:MAG: hydrogenase maturation protein [Burkholderiaceae bacterium]|nr:hydrogenase maturation protein [Burkholderiaceae bacterium]